jgi:DNA-binding MarR family transcriptional regulator
MSSDETNDLIDAVGLEFRRYQNATDEFEETVAELLGMNRTDLRCTDIIDRYGRITAGDLARETGLTTGAVTSILDRLERLGSVKRVRDQEDRRRVMVELTDKAIRGGKEIWGPLKKASRTSLSRFSDEQLSFVRDFLISSQQFMAQQAARVRGLPRKKLR